MATPASVGFVYNHDIIGFAHRLNRFIYELMKSVSSNVSQMNTFDQTRLKSYIANIRGFHDWVNEQPQLDLPETSPRMWPLDPAPAVDVVENEEVNDLIRMLGIARDELVNSQSARQGSGLVKYDSVRFAAIVNKVEAFLDSYVIPLTPMDFPESSPNDPMSGAGLGGV